MRRVKCGQAPATPSLKLHAEQIFNSTVQPIPQRFHWNPANSLITSTYDNCANMGKRKRDSIESGQCSKIAGESAKQSKPLDAPDGQAQSMDSQIIIQVIVGTYEKTLHGIQAMFNIEAPESSDVQFADTFLLSPHNAAIRCLALSPVSASEQFESQRLILASGSSDQVINLYHISRTAQVRPSLSGEKVSGLPELHIKDTPKNKELGSLQHHGGSVNALCFPTRSKLISAADDNTMSIARTRDWTILSTIKAPIPKARGRPSGDTAPLGEGPTGINDLAVHPSMKLMVSVGKGERCMRLWNLVTGKKAGVLNFDRDLLNGVGEGKWASGEGRRVRWNSTGEEFVVGFERGCIAFGVVR